MITDDKNWPAWRYGPEGESRVFDSEAEVPAGWQDHPSKVTAKAAPKPAPTPAATGAAPVPGAAAPVTDDKAVDAHGWPFDDALHAATRTQTKAGLWRMKVGVSRPAPKPGFPKPVLDL